MGGNAAPLPPAVASRYALGPLPTLPPGQLLGGADQPASSDSDSDSEFARAEASAPAPALASPLVFSQTRVLASTASLASAASLEGMGDEGESISMTASNTTSQAGASSTESMDTETRGRMEQVGLVGSHSTSLWVGGIPDFAATEPTLKFLFGRFGEIRRLYLRKKDAPAMSWCLLIFRASDGAAAAIAKPPMVLAPDKTEHTLLVQWPKVEEHLAKADAGALGSVIDQALDDGSRSPSAPMDGRRRSMTEMEVRDSISGTGEVKPENSEALADSAGRKRWTSLKTSKSRRMVSAMVMFGATNDDDNEKAAKKAIKEKLEALTSIEPDLTNVLQALSALNGGELRGLDFRFKTASSLFRKLMSRLDTTMSACNMSERPPTAGEILSGILDILRYTAVFPTKVYTSAVRMMLASLVERGCKELRVKNYWGPGDGYQGINTVFVTAGGEPFELQFHTPESLTMKEEECHSSYEKFRSATNTHKMMQYWEEMVSMWDMVPVPEDVLNIPVVIQQVLEFDISQLSADERAAIKHRKSLEKICRYPVGELHSRALKAEPECTSLMMWLMNKHGPAGLCEVRELKSALRAQLSILRQLVDTFNKEEEAAEEAVEDSALAFAQHTESVKKRAELESLGSVPGTPASPGLQARAASSPSLQPESIKRTRRKRASTIDLEAGMDKMSVKVGVRKMPPAVAEPGPPDGTLKNPNEKSLNGKNKPLGFVKQAYTGSHSGGGSYNLTKSVYVDIAERMPDETQMRDKLRELECDFPPLKYSVVITNEVMYNVVVRGFLKDIANDDDYDIYAVNNWWDDLEKFGAVNARFLATRHGIRFEVTLHTAASYEALIAHGEHMRRKFSTVIKTDVLFAADTAKVEEAKQQMRREDMWRERWAQISVPDRALTIGSLRYAHEPPPSPDKQLHDALQTVGQLRPGKSRLWNAARAVKTSMHSMHSMHSMVLHDDVEDSTSSAPSGHTSLVASRNASMHDESADRGGSRDGLLGSAWVEVTSAFLASDDGIRAKFDRFRRQYTLTRGDSRLWEPWAARLAGLETQVMELRAAAGSEQSAGCFGRRKKKATWKVAPAGANNVHMYAGKDSTEAWSGYAEGIVQLAP